MKNLVLGVNDAIYRACVIVAALAIVIMATIIPWGVFSRYALGQGLGWPEPIAILLMVLFTFVGAAASYRAGAHMAVQVLSDRLPLAAQPFLTLFVRLAMAAISLFMLIWGYKLCLATWNQYLSTLTWMRVGDKRIQVIALASAFSIERLMRVREVPENMGEIGRASCRERV